MSNNNNNQNPQEQQQDEPVLNRLPFSMFQNQNENPPQNHNQHHQNEVGFFDSLTSTEVIDIGTYFFPSLIYLIAIIVGLALTTKLCTESYSVMFNIMIVINSFCIARAIYQVIMIALKAHENPIGKESFSISNYILYPVYYACTIGCYVVFSMRPDNCFTDNTYLTCLIFVFGFLGIIGIGRYILNVIIFFITFPIMINFYLKNPSEFYFQFGIDPELVKNLPTGVAEQIHCTTCVICAEDIKIGDEILVLRCQGRHHFHASCIKDWLMYKVNCPVCRSREVI